MGRNVFVWKGHTSDAAVGVRLCSLWPENDKSISAAPLTFEASCIHLCLLTLLLLPPLPLPGPSVAPCRVAAAFHPVGFDDRTQPPVQLHALMPVAVTATDRFRPLVPRCTLPPLPPLDLCYTQQSGCGIPIFWL